MQHIYIKQKIPPQKPQNHSVKPFIYALGAIFLLVGFYLTKEYYQKKNDQTKIQLKNTDKTSQKEPEVPLISASEVSNLIKKPSIQLIDIRDRNSFEKEHIESSINIPLSSDTIDFSKVDKTKELIILDKKNTINGKQLTAQLIQIGYQVKYLDKGMEFYLFQRLPAISFGDPQSLEDKSKTNPLSAMELNKRAMEGEEFKYIDVRSKEEFNKSHIEEAVNIPLEEIEQRKADIPIGKLVIYDNDPMRSYKAAVKLYDMHYWGAYFLSDSIQTLKEISKNSTNSSSENTETKP